MYQSSNFATIKFLFEAHADACRVTKLRASYEALAWSLTQSRTFGPTDIFDVTIAYGHFTDDSHQKANGGLAVAVEANHNKHMIL